jgi:hypothetical protein
MANSTRRASKNGGRSSHWKRAADRSMRDWTCAGNPAFKRERHSALWGEREPVSDCAAPMRSASRARTANSGRTQGGTALALSFRDRRRAQTGPSDLADAHSRNARSSRRAIGTAGSSPVNQKSPPSPPSITRIPLSRADARKGAESPISPWNRAGPKCDRPRGPSNFRCLR